MFIAMPSITQGAVRRAGKQLASDHSISFRPAEPRRRLMFDNAIDMSLLPE